MFCSNCGSKLVEGAKFCSNCGAPVVAVENVAVKPEEPVNKAADKVVKDSPLDFEIKWETVDDEAPDKAAFDKRVSFDWTSVIDESHKKEVKDIRSPWDPEPVKAENSFEQAPKKEKSVEDKDLMKEFEGIDVTPTTEKGRTLTFIEILKKEREEKEKAANEAAAKLFEKEPTDEGDSFEDLSSMPETKFEIKEPVIEPFKTVEPVATGGVDFAENMEPAHEPMSFVQSAEEEMTDLKEAYDDAKSEVPAFELPSFWTNADDEDEDEVEVETAEEQYSNNDYEIEDADEENFDEYLSYEPESYDVEADDDDDVVDEEAQPESKVEDAYVEDAYVDNNSEIHREKLTEEKLQEELAAILAAGSGYTPSVEKSAEEENKVDIDMYESLNESAERPKRDANVDERELPKHDSLTEQDEDDEEFYSYGEGLGPKDEPEYVDAVEREMEATQDETEAEEYFADMIGAVTDKANDPLADAESLKLEDIFDDEYLKGEETDEVAAVEQEEKPELTDKESEIEALKRRLAELLSDQQETVVPANPDTPTIEEIFNEPDDVVALVDEKVDDNTVAEEVSDSVVAEPEVVQKNEALEDLADIQSDAMSIEDLEKDLFGDAALGEDMEAEATRKIDKFYTLYKKNEEFQKLLDDEYNRIQLQEDEPSELSDATITQLDNLVLPAEELGKEIKEEKAAREDIFEKAEVAEVELEAPVLEEETLSPKEAKKAAKAAKKAAKKKAAKEDLEMEEDEEEAGTALTVVAVVIAILLVILLAAILILNFAPDSAIGLKLDALVQNISGVEALFDANDGSLL